MFLNKIFVEFTGKTDSKGTSIKKNDNRESALSYPITNV